jgi:ACS family glucarate transporter-like MFS transporter
LEMPKHYLIVFITAIAAYWMYIDRVCFSTLADTIQKDLGISDDDKGFILGAFFFTYALFQIPMGALADRFGARLVLTISIAAWSVVTAATGFAHTFSALLVLRLLLGITESGAYPAAAGLVKRWARPEERGFFSSVVALGGRLGGATAPALTATLAAFLIGVGVVEYLYTPPPPVIPLGAKEHERANWRGVFAIYGFCGLAVASLFWLFVRDRPPAHLEPGKSNSSKDGSAEIVSGQKAEEWHALPPGRDSTAEQSSSLTQSTLFAKVALLAGNKNMLFFGAVQFGVNLGWAFLITLLPTYLNNAFGVPLEKRGQMQSVALTTGCFGMFFGGIVTDAIRSWLGPRYGRSIPIGAPLGFCAVVFLVAPMLPTAWAVVVALGVMAFLVDLHNPSIWSFAQDVGGKNVGAALGWGNMWGNLGAALSPVLLTAIWKAAGWNVVFLFCALSFAAAATCGLLLDATKPVDAGDAG